MSWRFNVPELYHKPQHPETRFSRGGNRLGSPTFAPVASRRPGGFPRARAGSGPSRRPSDIPSTDVRTLARILPRVHLRSCRQARSVLVSSPCLSQRSTRHRCQQSRSDARGGRTQPQHVVRSYHSTVACMEPYSTVRFDGWCRGSVANTPALCSALSIFCRIYRCIRSGRCAADTAIFLRMLRPILPRSFVLKLTAGLLWRPSYWLVLLSLTVRTWASARLRTGATALSVTSGTAGRRREGSVRPSGHQR